MAANGFIELLLLIQAGNKQYASTQNEVSRWSGIAFEMLGNILLHHWGEISEVIYLQNIPCSKYSGMGTWFGKYSWAIAFSF